MTHDENIAQVVRAYNPVMLTVEEARIIMAALQAAQRLARAGLRDGIGNPADQQQLAELEAAWQGSGNQ